MQRTVALWLDECSIYQSPASHWLENRQPISCSNIISYGLCEFQFNHSSNCKPSDAFQQNTFNASVHEVYWCSGMTFDEGVLKSLINCWHIRKGISEYQKSRFRYCVQPIWKTLLQVLLKLRLMRLHLDGSTIWPQPAVAQTSWRFVPDLTCSGVALTLLPLGDGEISITLRYV